MATTHLIWREWRGLTRCHTSISQTSDKEHATSQFIMHAISVLNASQNHVCISFVFRYPRSATSSCSTFPDSNAKVSVMAERCHGNEGVRSVSTMCCSAVGTVESSDLSSYISNHHTSQLTWGLSGRAPCVGSTVDASVALRAWASCSNFVPELLSCTHLARAICASIGTDPHRRPRSDTPQSRNRPALHPRG